MVSDSLTQSVTDVGISLSGSSPKRDSMLKIIWPVGLSAISQAVYLLSSLSKDNNFFRFGGLGQQDPDSPFTEKSQQYQWGAGGEQIN